MPRSKRSKQVSLTRTKAKGKTQKLKLIESIRNNVDEYKHIYVFTFDNLRAGLFATVRQSWRESRFFLGKHTFAQIALGRKPEEEFKDNLHNVSKLLTGDTGLLFTSRDDSEVTGFFNSFREMEFAKAGAILDRDIVVSPGPLPNAAAFPSTMLDQFRKLGLVVELEDGIIMLRESYVAARAGEPLTPEQAKCLERFNMKTVEFSLKLTAHWSDGEFEELA